VTINLALSNRKRLTSEVKARLRLPRPTQTMDYSPSEHQPIWDAVAKLSPQQRAAIALHYLEDQPVNKIAEILGCSEATAKVHLHRGRNALAVTLEGVKS